MNNNRSPQVALNVTLRGSFNHLYTKTILVPGETPVVNLWPAVVREVREQTSFDGSQIEKIALVKER